MDPGGGCLDGNTEVNCTPGWLSGKVQKESEPEVVLNWQSSVVEKGTGRKNRNTDQVECKGKNTRKANTNLVSTPNVRNLFNKQSLM